MNKHKFTKGDVHVRLTVPGQFGGSRVEHTTIEGLRCGWLAITPTVRLDSDGRPYGVRRTRNVTHIPSGYMLTWPPDGVYGIDCYSLAAFRLWVGCLLDAAPSPDFWETLSDSVGQGEVSPVMVRARELYVAAVARMVCGEPAPEMQP